MVIKLFVMGIDTGVGKTYVSVRLLSKFNQLGFSTLGVKPVASGGLPNEDALALQKASSVKAAYEIVNPFAFEQPIAPHIAAQEQGITLTVEGIVDALQRAFEQKSDVYIIEGVGGWNIPLNHEACMSDVVVRLKIPVVLVVAIRLGCLNHAILTTQAIEQSGVPLIGWVANHVDKNVDRAQENINMLRSWITAPCLGIVPYCALG